MENLDLDEKWKKIEPKEPEETIDGVPEIATHICTWKKDYNILELYKGDDRFWLYFEQGSMGRYIMEFDTEEEVKKQIIKHSE
jgi:hypothetical protein